jgi:hypothetical protein
MSHPIFLKWSPSIKDLFYEKSKLKDKYNSIGQNVMETILQEGPTFIDNETVREIGFIDRRTNAEHEFLNGDTNMSSNVGTSMGSATKRENNFERMNQRQMVAQTNLNPFLSSNYLEDLRVQETFLTPQNSNIQQNYFNE